MSLVLLDREVRPHVSVITLNKPDRLNSMSFPLVEALYEALDAVGRDNDTWVVVMTGTGRAFCSGLDLHDRGIPPNTQDLGLEALGIELDPRGRIPVRSPSRGSCAGCFANPR